MKDKTKKKIKIYGKRLSYLLTFSLCGAYGSSCIAYGLNNINKTLLMDTNSIIYDIDCDINGKENTKFSNLKSIKLDISKEEDLLYLKKYKKIKYVEIINAQLLNNLTIEELNLLNASEVNLYFDRAYVLNHINEGFDLSRINNVKTVNFIERFNNDEIDSIIFFEYLKNYNVQELNISKYINLNAELNNIIKSLNINKDSKNNDMNNIFKILKYVIDKIEYDENVVSYNNKSNMYKLLDKSNLDIIKYNEKTLSTILYNKGTSIGVCSNYSDLFLALAIKSNVLANTVKGTYKNFGHSWNVIMLQNKNVYIDATWLDNNEEFNQLLDEYIENNSVETLAKLCNNFIINTNSSNVKDYKTDYPLEYYTDDDVKYHKLNNIYGTNESQIKLLLNFIYGIGLYEFISLSLCLIIIIENRKKEKDMLKSK